MQFMTCIKLRVWTYSGTRKLTREMVVGTQIARIFFEDLQGFAETSKMQFTCVKIPFLNAHAASIFNSDRSGTRNHTVEQKI